MINQDNFLWIVFATFVFILVMGIISHINKTKYDRKLKSALEEAEKATRIKEALLANLSHEIRTPMNAIIGFTYMLSQSEQGEKERSILEKIKNSSNLLLSIVNDILDFSKIEAGKVEIERVEFDINTVLKDVANIVGLKAKERGIELVFSMEKGVPAKMKGDPLRLTQVLINLINNGIKFTEHGSVTLEIERPEVTQDKKRMLRFKVVDTGIGIQEEQIPKLFNLFSQAENSTSRKYGGTGLGLNISKNLVELMGGEIYATSKYGEGSSFIFTIAIEPVYEVDRRSYRLPSRQQMDKNVLIVDKKTKTAETLKEMLEYFHHKCWRASDAKKLRELFAVHSFDLIVVDEKMLRLCLDKSILHKCKSKIVMMSATKQDVSEKLSREIKIDACLHKPFSQRMVYELVVDVFGDKESAEQLKSRVYTHKDLAVLKGSSILLADDNVMNQTVVRGLLEGTGIDITTVENGQKAVEAIMEDNTFELILMDINMPVMDGYSATAIIREYPQFDHIPIIALSANLKGDGSSQMEKLGLQDYLDKPIDVERFYEMLLQYIPVKIDASNVVYVPNSQEDEGDKSALVDTLREIDVEEGLSRINSNTKLYRTVLYDFADSLKDSVRKFNHMILHNNHKEAEDLAHYHKSIAGNLGAKKLYETLKELESVFSSGSKELYGALLDNLDKQIQVLLYDIKTLKRKKESISRKSLDLIGRDKMRLLLLNIRQHAKKGKAAQCKKVIDELSGYRMTHEDKKIFDEVAASVKTYNFKMTAKIIDDHFKGKPAGNIFKV
ncbi:MAG: hypothetical protein B5M52_00110 [Helicobacteraceae bacterium 4484_230]|nr:MAG: hypothetical protein B5M52_00110 [Helicobacteraceae bacterium 4484_230]